MRERTVRIIGRGSLGPDPHVGEIMSMLGEGESLCAHNGDELCASASKACERKACEREYE